MPQIRQYIGARYTPKFMGTYDATQSYEALSVVDNGMGTTYINEKPTPAGIPLTNTNYWHVYGASSGAIIDLQNQIDDVRSGGSIIFIGASYGLNPSTSDNCIVYLREMLATSYKHIYSNLESLSGFVNGKFLQLIQGVTLDPDDNASNVKDIILFEIGSDIGESEADLVSAITDFTDYCATAYPNARVQLAPMTCRYNPTDAAAEKQCLDYIINNSTTHKMGVMTDIYHIPAIDYDKYIAANLHPTTDGAKLIANAIANKLMNGGFKINTTAYSDGTGKTFSTFIGTPSLFGETAFITNDEIHLLFALSATAQHAKEITTNIFGAVLCDCMPQIKGVDNRNVKCMDGTLTDITAGVTIPVRVAIGYLSTSYYYYIATLSGQSYTIPSGNNFAIRVTGTYPFILN